MLRVPSARATARSLPSCTRYPSPFNEILDIFSFFSFDFLSLECFQDAKDRYFTTVYVWSTIPVVMACANVALYFVSLASPSCVGNSHIPNADTNSTTTITTNNNNTRSCMCLRQAPMVTSAVRLCDFGQARRLLIPFELPMPSSMIGAATSRGGAETFGSEPEGLAAGSAEKSAAKQKVEAVVKRRKDRLRQIKSQAVYLFLLLTYLVLPAVAMKQFQALDCIPFAHDGSAFLRIDTGIDCNGAFRRGPCISNLRL